MPDGAFWWLCALFGAVVAALVFWVVGKLGEEMKGWG
jgi:divalent metal cation (Fe/Co/Zn/Cd) transporter